MGQFVYVIRKRIKLAPEKAIFIFVDEVLPPTAALMSAIYEEHKYVVWFPWCVPSIDLISGMRTASSTSATRERTPSGRGECPRAFIYPSPSLAACLVGSQFHPFVVTALSRRGLQQHRYRPGACTGLSFPHLLPSPADTHPAQSSLAAAATPPLLPRVSR